MFASTKLAINYAIFALIATAANIGAQDLVIRTYSGDFDILASVIVGTGVGLVVKYILDKRYIFRFRARNVAHDTQTFALYTVMGLATSMLAYLNVSNIAGVAVQLQKKDPEKYPEPDGTINGNLIIDSTLTYFSSVAGIGMGLLNIAAGVGTVYLGMKSGS